MDEVANTWDLASCALCSWGWTHLLPSCPYARLPYCSCMPRCVARFSIIGSFSAIMLWEFGVTTLCACINMPQPLRVYKCTRVVHHLTKYNSAYAKQNKYKSPPMNHLCLLTGVLGESILLRQVLYLSSAPTQWWVAGILQQSSWEWQSSHRSHLGPRVEPQTEEELYTHLYECNVFLFCTPFFNAPQKYCA